MAAANTQTLPKISASASLERAKRTDSSRLVLLLPAVLLVLAFSIFPLIVSVYLSLSRINVTTNPIDVQFIGLGNYIKQLFGSEQRHFLGRFGEVGPAGYLILGAALAFLLYMLYQYIRSPRFRPVGVVFRLITISLLMFFTWQFVVAFSGNGLPGTLTVTLIFVFGGVTLQYLLGLGLAMLLTQKLAGRRFFRVAFLLPMMVTPVGVGFLFRMLVDTVQGPVKPLWVALGLEKFSWATDPNIVRTVIILSDTWQWTPFMFIILLAALEGVSREVMEAALVDGTTRWQMFRNIILPEILPVSTTLILIRMIEAFKLVDLPNSLLGGGPGTASESITLSAYKAFRAPELHTSSALAYLLLFVVTFFSLVFFTHIRRRLLERI